MVVGNFPFGQPIQHIVQADRSPKRVFILGVYASAVHARWCDPRGTQMVQALGVASEPYIFWRGEGLEEILSAIDVPLAAGRLLAAHARFNGPSGRSVDEDFLQPLGLTREDAWLCDLVPHSCMNECQAKAISERYTPLVEQFALPPVNWPTRPSKLNNVARREEIADELWESTAEVLVTLGDDPLKWFGAAFGTKASLEAYGKVSQDYGLLHDVVIKDRALKLLPLVHPRQADGLGRHDPRWKDLHENWVRQVAPVVRTRL